MKRLVASMILLALLVGCNPLDGTEVFSLSNEQLFQNAETGWRDAGYALSRKPESSPLPFTASDRYYDVGNGDTLAIYIFPTVKEASEAKQTLTIQHPSASDSIIPIYAVKANILFIYFTPNRYSEPSIFEKVEKIVSDINLNS